ncbi:hypothetical protein LQL77_07095 [Rhodococcus cerastii]|nr:hypothetical protein [Rhodococcus cerastii]
MWQDVAILLKKVLENVDQAAFDSENLAMLLDRDDFYLNSEYSQWVTDPNDPQVKAERARRLKYGIKPPPVPVLRPVAMRRADLTAILSKKYASTGSLIEQSTPEPVAPSGHSSGETIKLSAREAARLLWS